MSVRVRIAPSPTGSIHIGLARTALYNALYARKHEGTFVLRVEDTDEKRNMESSEQQIYDGLRWLGINWDEGPDKGGDYGPYRQSERKTLYRKYLEQLVGENKIYPCYCTREELERERNEQQKHGLPPIYSGRCRTANAERIDAWKREGREPILRFATHGERLTFDDLVRGRIEFHAEYIGDFSVARDLDHPLYNFAVVIDDTLMQISHVIRGEEHLSNTPKQMLLLQAIGASIPVYAHLPLLLGTDRKKLSKRDDAVSVGEYREQGFLPEALLNFLALLGWHPKDDRERFTFDELVEVFRLEDVQKAGAIVDRKKLESINAQYIRSMPPREVIQRAGEALTTYENAIGRDTLIRAVALVHDRLVTIRELPEALRFLFPPNEYPPELLVPQKGSLKRTKDVLGKLREYFGSMMEEAMPGEGELKEQTLAWIRKIGSTNMETLWPLRVALTGQKNSPEVFGIASLLMQKDITNRINTAIQKIANLV